MADIVINLDEPVFAPTLNKPLLSMVIDGGFRWPKGPTCLTQECDGEIIWWSESVSDVLAARKVANLEDGLMPLIGLGQQVHVEYYTIDEQAFVANDWKLAVVTREEVDRLESQLDRW